MTYQYIRKPHYHETDQMGIIHHTNYIKWFEEARIDLMTQMGLPYSFMEEKGIIIPVIHISCDYKQMVRFDQDVVVYTTIEKYNGVRFTATYEVKDLKGEMVFVTGCSKHCFLNSDMRPVILQREAPDMHEVFNKMLK